MEERKEDRRQWHLMPSHSVTVVINDCGRSFACSPFHRVHLPIVVELNCVAVIFCQSYDEDDDDCNVC